MCLERIEFDYINLATNVSKFKKEFKAPFKERSEFDLEDRLIPCNDNFDYITTVIALSSREGVVYCLLM